MFSSEAHPERRLRAGNLLGDNTGLALFLLCLIAPLPVFWFGFQALFSAWITPEYSHGPLIPLLSAFMFMREMTKVPSPERPVTDRWPGVALVVFALALAVLGNLVRIPDIVFYAVIFWVGGLVLTAFGFRRGWIFWPAVLHLVFMLPLPNFIQWQVTIYLQFVSSELGVWFVRLAGIPVYLDGNVIDLGVYKLLVAEACSGLRYLFPIMSFSYIFCVLYNGPRWHKAVLLLAAVPMAIFMNSFRIGMIGILVDNYGIGHAEGFLHYFEGWVIFGACVGLLFLLARVLQWSNGDRRPLSEALDLEFAGLGPQFRRALDIRVSPALVTATVVASLVGAVWLVAPKLEPVVVERSDFDLFPRQIGEWRGTPSTLEPDIERVLNADDYFIADYRSEAGGGAVDFFVAYYHKQTEGSGIHSPEVCLPAGGWEMFQIEQVEVALSAETGIEPFNVNRAIIQKGQVKQLVYYWFEQRGRRITNDFVAKGVTVLDSLTRGRTDGALVRLVTPLPPTGGEAEADARLLAFLEGAMPELARFVPY